MQESPTTTPPVDQPKQEERMEAINQLGQIQIPTFKSDIHCVTINGQVEGHMILPPNNKTTKYEHLMPQLVAVEENPDIKGLLMILNTVGGDVEAGLAISEMIASLSKPTVSIVMGGGHSIGACIAVSTNYSFIAPSATMTIHPIRLTGLVVSVPQTWEYLEKMQDRVIRFTTEHSKITEEKMRELMYKTGDLARDIGTVLLGEDAVKCGLIDEVGGLKESLNMLHQLQNQDRGLKQ